MKQKSILITGASTGFGRQTAELLAQQGHYVFASMRGVTGKNEPHATSLTNWAAANNLKLEVVELDVTSDASVAQAAASILKATGGTLDVIVNNAGIYGGGIQESFTVEDYKYFFDVNVFGPARVNNTFLPVLRKQKSGLIIQISSVLGRFVIPFGGVYDATKYAVEALSENLAYELKPLGIDVAIVQPGVFATEIVQKQFTPGNTAIVAEYGRSLELLQAFGENFFKTVSDPALPNKPVHVAEAIARLIALPKGEVPLRTLVDQLMPAPGQHVNRAAAEVQDQILNGFGLAEMAVKQLETELA